MKLGIMFIYLNISSCTETNSKNATNHSVIQVDETGNNKKGAIHIQFIDKAKFNGTLKLKTRETGRIEYLVFYDDLESELIPIEDIAEKKTAIYSTFSNQVVVRRYLSFFEFQDFLVHKGDSLIMSFDNDKPVVVKHSNYNYAPQDFNVENSLNKKFAESCTITGKADDTRRVAFKHFYDDPQESKNQQMRKGYEKGLYNENLENLMGKMLIPSVEILNNDTQQFLDSLNENKLISNEVHELSAKIFQFIVKIKNNVRFD
jgi:hypothetical protein